MVTVTPLGSFTGLLRQSATLLQAEQCLSGRETTATNFPDIASPHDSESCPRIFALHGTENPIVFNHSSLRKSIKTS